MTACTRCGSTRLVWRSVIGVRTETLCAGCREPWRRFVLGVLASGLGGAVEVRT